ncbi:hypothetical protein GCM10009819_18770 [Agromyces tropicus]|uniref:DUF4345 domain-containing protein n=1 Tax=Agromyces tropicus TaxID=555371 RepID=A0ABN2UDB6_9MICO
MVFARIDAVLTWVYVVGFGVTAIPIAAYHVATGRLPTFFGLFTVYGGRWSDQFAPPMFAGLLVAFAVTTLVVGFAAWLLWQGWRIGAVLSLATLPVEAVFWIGFDLPIPWIVAAARIVFAILAWGSLASATTSAHAAG